MLGNWVRTFSKYWTTYNEKLCDEINNSPPYQQCFSMRLYFCVTPPAVTALQLSRTFEAFWSHLMSSQHHVRSQIFAFSLASEVSRPRNQFLCCSLQACRVICRICRSWSGRCKCVLRLLCFNTPVLNNLYLYTKYIHNAKQSNHFTHESVSFSVPKFSFPKFFCLTVDALNM